MSICAHLWPSKVSGINPRIAQEQRFVILIGVHKVGLLGLVVKWSKFRFI